MTPPVNTIEQHHIDEAKETLAALADRAGDACCFVGFDGFVDSIIDVVARRTAPGDGGYERMSSLQEFARVSAEAAGRSANIELVVTGQRAGGNGPILAGALAKLGAEVRCVGAIDHPVFDSLRTACGSTVSLGEPGATDALEFDDGKLMLGKTGPMDSISWDRIVERSGGIDALVEQCNASRIIAPLGWTMVPAMNSVWAGFESEVLPRLDDPSAHEFFIDLSDPAKRSEVDLRGALALLRRINAITPVTLGLNVAEALRLQGITGGSAPSPGTPTQTDLAALAAGLLGPLGVGRVAVHHHQSAALCDNHGCWASPTAFTPAPRTSTGAGDHFNAGLCLALAHGCAAPTALLSAIAVSGLFVRTGQHPSLEDAAVSLDSLQPG